MEKAKDLTACRGRLRSLALWRREASAQREETVARLVGMLEGLLKTFIVRGVMTFSRLEEKRRSSPFDLLYRPPRAGCVQRLR